MTALLPLPCLLAIAAIYKLHCLPILSSSVAMAVQAFFFSKTSDLAVVEAWILPHHFYKFLVSVHAHGFPVLSIKFHVKVETYLSLRVCHVNFGMLLCYITAAIRYVNFVV